jgi:putative PIN family toxin of toxin-antitoxin system
MSQKPRVVIDPQLFLRAAVNLKSLPAKFIDGLRSRYQLITSVDINREVEDVLKRPAIRAKLPHLTDESIQSIMDLLAVAETITPVETPSVSRDPKDDKFLACAKAAGADYIVSEDKDLLVLDPYQGIRIVNASDFLRIGESLPEE